MLFGRRAKSSEVAKKRLQLVIIHDRADISSDILEDLRKELIQVINKYLIIDEKNIDIELTKDNQSVALVASIPIKSVRRKPHVNPKRG